MQKILCGHHSVVELIQEFQNNLEITEDFIRRSSLVREVED